MADPTKEFIRAAKADDLTTLKTLLKDDQDLLESRDTDGSTALHCACWKGHLEDVRFLVQAGADLQAHNTNNHWGTTPLRAAVHANRAAIATLLIEAGADVNARDMNGQTPLHHTGF
jgi:ankyrin repeat protein